jgi:hypothetical protein
MVSRATCSIGEFSKKGRRLLTSEPPMRFDAAKLSGFSGSTSCQIGPVATKGRSSWPIWSAWARCTERAEGGPALVYLARQGAWNSSYEDCAFVTLAAAERDEFWRRT